MESAEGIASIPSRYSIGETVEKLKAAIAGKGLHLFSHIDHGAGAVQAGLSMPAAHVLIFGSPKAGTPLMVARPLLALELPLKVLVWENAERAVFASFNTAEFLSRRHALPADLAKNIAGVEPLVKAALA